MPLKEYIITVNNIAVWVKYSKREFISICDFLERQDIQFTYKIKNLI